MNKNLIETGFTEADLTGKVKRPTEYQLEHTDECRDVPFKFKRKGNYKSSKGARVNMTYLLTTGNCRGHGF